MVTKTSSPVSVLSVGPIDEHQIALAEILCRSGQDAHPDVQWKLQFCSSLQASLPALDRGNIPIVLCDRDHDPAAWKRMLERLAFLPDPPCMIVTSRLADERLWCEALNLGAHDVLAKPFDAAEVTRVLSHAWHRRGQAVVRGAAAPVLALPA